MTAALIFCLQYLSVRGGFEIPEFVKKYSNFEPK